MCSRMKLSISLAFFCFLYVKATPSHFRGGTMYISPAKNSDMIELKYRLSWQQSYAEEYFCDASTLAMHNVISVDGNMTAKGKCAVEFISPLPLQCTDYSILDDWMTGIYTTSLQCSNTYVEITYQGIGWPTMQNGNGNWSLFLNASLEKRTDTGRINNSPITLMRPIIRILTGCNYTFTVPVADNDGDIIRCRWSTRNNVDECGDLCVNINGVSLDQESCSLHYTQNSIQPGTYGVAIQIEDFTQTETATPMSSIPLQFMIDFVRHEVPCQYPHVSDSVNAKSIDVGIGTTFKDTVIGTSQDDTQYIIGIDLATPLGMNRSILQNDQNDDSGQTWFVNVNWLPTDDQEGLNLFCFVAINNLNLTSIQRCVEVNAEVSTGGSAESDESNEIWKEAVAGTFSTLAFISVICLVIMCLTKSSNVSRNKISVSSGHAYDGQISLTSSRSVPGYGNHSHLPPLSCYPPPPPPPVYSYNDVFPGMKTASPLPPIKPGKYE